MNTIRLCPGCGAALPPDAPAGLCPACLLRSEVLSQDTTNQTPAAPVRPPPIPGQCFGDYQILRLLGHGGMGEVFEAEHLATGRRVALKVMSHALSSDADRKRFLREGRLAASINHPNVVYIHGSEEIDGAPVIAMELVHGGTLKDRLKHEGPLGLAEAVEAALQIIAGLEAAHAAGVLHRDIKPANCFVDADGVVKVGDFGLSVSTLARGESLLTATGVVLGTPAYASPEQLRGEALDVRSDIYSVGATLYHLLTGSTPFGAVDFVKLITEVLDKPAAPPTAIRPDIPVALSRIIVRCLAKERRARFQSYAELRDALLPFCARESVPAQPGKRFLAGMIDDFLAYGPGALFLVYWSFDPLEFFLREQTLQSALVWLAFHLWYVGYYAVTEGFWGAGLGKTLCGLHVVGPDRQPPGLWRALLRAAIFGSPGVLPPLVLMLLMPLDEMRAALARNEILITEWLWLPLFVLLFVTMRRRNGYAAVHGLLSQTRVLVRPRTEPRMTLRQLLNLAPAPDDKPRPQAHDLPTPQDGGQGSEQTVKVGPYDVRASLWRQHDEELLLAVDPALRRTVWIHLRTSDAKSIPASRRDLSRPGRLRWLNEGHTASHRWDAYEAVDGLPLLQLRPAPWKAVRGWLLDLADELSAGLKDQTTAPPLSLDRIWIAAHGRALLLDFAAPGQPPRADAPQPLDDMDAMQRFLDTMARTALWSDAGKMSGPPASGSLGPRLPLHTQGFLNGLHYRAFEKPEFILGNLHSLLGKPAEVTRPWRMASLAFGPTVFAFLGLTLAAMVSFEQVRWERAWANAHPGKPSLRRALQAYGEKINERTLGTATDRDVELARVFLVHHFGAMATDESFWTNPDVSSVFLEEERALLRQAVSNHLPPDAEDVKRAGRVVSAWLRQQADAERSMPLFVFIGALLAGAFIHAMTELAGCVFLGFSPLLRLFGISVINREGLPAGRRRLLCRWVLGWVPAGLILLIPAGVLLLRLTGQAEGAATTWQGVAPAGIVVLGIILAIGLGGIVRPQRGLHDHLAGTWLVPR